MINMTGWDLGTAHISCCQVFVCLWQIWQQTRALKKVLKELNKLVFSLPLDWRAEGKKTQWLDLKKNPGSGESWSSGSVKSQASINLFILKYAEGCIYIYIFLYKDPGNAMFLYHWESVFWTKHISDVKALRKWTHQISLLVQGFSKCCCSKENTRLFKSLSKLQITKLTIIRVKISFSVTPNLTLL